MRQLLAAVTALESRELQNPQQFNASAHRWGVILAGGDGRRLQPLTRLACGDNRPKQFCPLLGGATLLAHTRQRTSRVIQPNRVLFVLTKKHERFYRLELNSVPDSQKIVQPHNQGTLPAILWSLLRLSHADEHALVAFFPSDHYFANEDGFISAIESTFDFVDSNRNAVVLLGAGADRPETDYGWIEPASFAAPVSSSNIVPVRRFWEKPPLETARQLLRQGCLWNTFVMIGSARAFLDMIREAVPVLFQAFHVALADTYLELEEQNMQLAYDDIVPADFSASVLAESAERLFVANCGEVGWSDLGEPRRFISALTGADAENPWAVAGACNVCGLTSEQIVTVTGLPKHPEQMNHAGVSDLARSRYGAAPQEAQAQRTLIG